MFKVVTDLYYWSYFKVAQKEMYLWCFLSVEAELYIIVIIFL